MTSEKNMRKILTSKKGVSLLEGLIALLLLALVATGTFAVLLSTSRRSSQPDIREEMALAVERAMNKLQVYVKPSDGTLPTGYVSGYGNAKLCSEDTYGTALATTSSTTYHNISCMLPPICDSSNSSFTYEVSESSSIKTKLSGQFTEIGSLNFSGITMKQPYSIKFHITCNGYRL